MFKKLPEGVKRAIIVGYPALLIIVIFILIGNTNTVDAFLTAIVFVTPIYWICAFAGIWIYEGFNKS